MRKTASSILRELQVRVARLEKTSGYTSQMHPYTTAKDIELLPFIKRKIKKETGFSSIRDVDVVRRVVDYDYEDIDERQDDEILLEVTMHIGWGEEEEFYVLISVDQDGDQSFGAVLPRGISKREALKYL